MKLNNFIAYFLFACILSSPAWANEKIKQTCSSTYPEYSICVGVTNEGQNQLEAYAYNDTDMPTIIMPGIPELPDFFDSFFVTTSSTLVITVINQDTNSQIFQGTVSNYSELKCNETSCRES